MRKADPENQVRRSDERRERFSRSDYVEVEPVEVFTAPSRVNAEIVLSALRARDLRAYIAGTGLEQHSEAGGIGQITGIAGPLNSIRIMVHPEDEDDAREIIAAACDDFGEDETTRMTAAAAEGTIAPGERLDRFAKPLRNKSIVKGFALFLLLPLSIGTLSALYDLILYLTD